MKILNIFLRKDVRDFEKAFNTCSDKKGINSIICKTSVFLSIINKKVVIPVFLFLFSVFVLVDINIVDNYYGLFILKKQSGIGIEITNDLYSDQVRRLLFKFDFNPFYENVVVKKFTNKDEYPFLSFVWDKNNGRGFVRSFLSENRKLLFVFSRFKEDNGAIPRGLFLGGELPITSYNEDKDFLNDTGMAYYDGTRWYHIWCTTNQGLASAQDPNVLYTPATWKFIGSQVVKNDEKKLVLKSSHIAYVDGVPLAMDRFAYFKAGEPYFILDIKIKNIGDYVAGYYYIYGDEPWIGDYGYSEGDVGWTKEGLVLTEKEIDVTKHHFVGFFDYGNELIGEPHTFTNVASFIEWDPLTRPNSVYFSNQFGSVDHKKPLAHQLNRVVALQWGPYYLKPGEISELRLAVGMAYFNEILNFPMKPIVDFAIK